jgi:hypothetical protein
MFNRVKPGQRWQPKADEVNAMLAAGAALRSVPGLSALTDTPPGNAVIRVKNITGDTIQRYRAFGLGESLVADLEDSSRVPEVVLELVEWESGPVAVIQQPLADDEIGFALVSGVTLLEVSDEGSETDRQATPGTDGVCDPGSGPITLLMPRPADGGFVLAALGVGGSGGGRVVFPPSGGIPAATLNVGKTIVTMGTAECFLASVGTSGATKTYTKGSDVLRVYNTVRRVVGANGAPLQIKLDTSGLWVIDVEDCDG